MLFNKDNCSPNVKMESELSKNMLKSSTSLISIVCKDGVIMGADRQVTAGTLVVSKNFAKVMPINDYLVLSWTGGVSDAQRVGKIVAAELKLKELRARSRPSVKEAANLLSMITYNQIRQFSVIPSIVGSLMGGVNPDGSVELYSIEPAGSIIKVEDYDANFSSGMPYILGLLERQYKKDLTVSQGIELAKEALKSSTQRDVGSGYGIDIFTITKDGIKKAVSQQITSVYEDQ